MQVTFPPWAGTGRFCIETFGSGLRLMIVDMHFKVPVTIWGDTSLYKVGMGLNLAGRSESLSSSYSQPFEVETQRYAFFTYPDVVDIGEKMMPGPYRRIYILMEPETLFSLAQGDEQSFAPLLRGAEQSGFWMLPAVLPPQFQLIPQQILDCSYQGKIRSLFLEGKVLELLAHTLFHVQRKESVAMPVVNTQDEERVRHAAALLVQDMDSAPNLAQLSQAVGLSRSKLHRCFCQVYGKTPLSYLREHRLDKARQLLAQGRYNVMETAYAVGYECPSYFGRLFKEKYQITPHDFLHNSLSHNIEPSQSHLLFQANGISR